MLYDHRKTIIELVVSDERFLLVDVEGNTYLGDLAARNVSSAKWCGTQAIRAYSCGSVFFTLNAAKTLFIISPGESPEELTTGVADVVVRDLKIGGTCQ